MPVIVGKLVCVDSSYSRINRLREILRRYVPRSYTDEEQVEIVHGNGITFCELMQHERKFDKVRAASIFNMRAYYMLKYPLKCTHVVPTGAYFSGYLNNQ